MAGRQRRTGAVDVLLLLEQAEAWVGEDGVAVAVTELSMLERARLVRALRARARVAWLSSLLRRELGEPHGAHHEGETAESWIEARPLVRHLIELNRSSGDGPGRGWGPRLGEEAGVGAPAGPDDDGPGRGWGAAGRRPAAGASRPLSGPARRRTGGAAAPRGQ